MKDVAPKVLVCACFAVAGFSFVQILYAANSALKAKAQTQLAYNNDFETEKHNQMRERQKNDDDQWIVH